MANVVFVEAGGVEDVDEVAHKKRLPFCDNPFGGEYRSRTDDLLHAMQAL